MVVELVRLVAVMALVCVAAALLTPKGRLPLALRGLCKVLQRDRVLAGAARDGEPQPVSTGRRLLGLLFVFLAFAFAVIKL